MAKMINTSRYFSSRKLCETLRDALKLLKYEALMKWYIYF